METAADCHLTLGNLFIESRGYATSLRHYATACRLYPAHSRLQDPAKLGLATARIGLGRLTGIEAPLLSMFRNHECGVRLESGHVLAVLYRPQGRIDEALAVLQDAVRDDDQNAAPSRLAANTSEQRACHLIRGDHPAARTSLAALASLLNVADAGDRLTWVFAALLLDWQTPWPVPVSGPSYDYQRRWDSLISDVFASVVQGRNANATP